MKEKKEVVKHSAAVQIQNNITLLQRRAWNVLLANAYDVLPTEERHRMKVRDLMQALEFTSKNEDYLKEALMALVGCKVEWNVLDKDNKLEWGVTTLLAEAKIKSGVCTYAYGPTLRERLHNPQMYARISLSMQNKFESKHAQALWELCVDYLGTGRDYGETSYIIPLPFDAQIRHALALMHISHLKRAQLIAPDGVIEQRRQNGAVAFPFECVGRGSLQEQTGLMVAERRGDAFPVHRAGPFYPKHRVMQDRVTLTEIRIKRR
jgi:replication initiator protein